MSRSDKKRKTPELHHFVHHGSTLVFGPLSAQVEKYFYYMVYDTYKKSTDLDGIIWICIQTPAPRLHERFREHEYDISELAENIRFVDMISNMVGLSKDDPDTIYCVSPTDYKCMFLAIDNLIEKIGGSLIVFDNLGALLSYDSGERIVKVLRNINSRIPDKESIVLYMLAEGSTDTTVETAIQTTMDTVFKVDKGIEVISGGEISRYDKWYELGWEEYASAWEELESTSRRIDMVDMDELKKKKDVDEPIKALGGSIGDAETVGPLMKALGGSIGDAVNAFIGDAAVEPLMGSAIKALGEIGGSAVEPLIKSLGDSDDDVRHGAAKALSNIGDTAVEPLVGALGDSDDDVRHGAARALSNIGGAAVEPLKKALGDNNRFVRSHAAEVLGDIGDARAVEPLVGALGDSDENVRWHAAEALGKIGDPKAVEPLIELLGDSDENVRECVALALRELGYDPSA